MKEIMEFSSPQRGDLWVAPGASPGLECNATKNRPATNPFISIPFSRAELDNLQRGVLKPPIITETPL